MGIFHVRAQLRCGPCSLIVFGMNSSCGFSWAIKAKTSCPFKKMVLTEFQYFRNIQTIVSSRLSPFSKQCFLQRLWALKVFEVINIQTISQFLNGVRSFQMLCVTPEWKGLCMTHGFKSITQRVFLPHAANNYLIAGDKFLFKLEISHLEFRSSGENSSL